MRPWIKQICGHTSSDNTNTLLALISSARPWRYSTASWKWSAASRGWWLYGFAWAPYLQILAQTECQNATLNPSQTLVGVSLLLLVRSALGVSLSLSASFFAKSGECSFSACSPWLGRSNISIRLWLFSRREAPLQWQSRSSVLL